MKTLALAATWLSLTAGAALAADAPSNAPTDTLRSQDLSVAVEIDGSLPGFTQSQLSAFIAAQMDAADVAAWHVAPADAQKSAPEPPNRVVWHFKLLPFAGGAVRYIGPALSKARAMFGVGRAIGIDAKIYLDGRYQSSTFDQVTIKGGPNDPELESAIKKVTRIIVSDALTEDAETRKLFFG